MRTILRTCLLAALVVLAGCAGGSGLATPDGTVGDTATSTADGGTLRLYVSDQPAAIDEFRHLNVTVSRIGVQRGGENGSWTEYAVDNRTVDLTRLRGANASLLGQFPVESGTYSKVFVHVESVDATLSTGEEVRVKLPSGKLQITKPFEVAPNESVDFVFDIMVHKAGKSGKYVLRPVISESGTEVPIREVDDEDEAATLNVTAIGNVTPGGNATIEVTRNGTPVPNATVMMDDERVGRTDASGRLTVAVPADAEALELEVTAGDAEGELEVEFESPEEADEDEDETNESESRSALSVAFVGAVEPGEGATVRVTRNGTPVANVTVTVNGERAGTTDASGRLRIAVPADAEELTVQATDDGGGAEAEVDLTGG
ncbi:MAG: DUF4382 domain-containing protein [Halobacteriales archaeon]